MACVCVHVLNLLFLLLVSHSLVMSALLFRCFLCFRLLYTTWQSVDDLV
jgi:hypothetical protein